jgi:catechol 2,3-dioxygenase-like lactoylglutathione lyase family enzyme
MKPMFALLLCVAALPAEAQTDPTAPIQARGSFIAASVADLPASVAWYRDKLGLKVIMDRPADGEMGTGVAVLEGGGLIVELIRDPAAVPLHTAAPQIQQDYRVHGIFKGGVLVEDWDGLLALLRDRQVPIAIGPFAARKEMRANLIIRDNSGNYIQFFGAYLP